MPGISRKLACAGAGIALLVAGCGGGEGGGGGIPQETADQMLETVETIRTATAGEECDTAQQATTELRSQVANVESGETENALNEMIDSLDRNLDDECPPGVTGAEQEQRPDEEEEPTEPTTTTTVPTTPTTTTTTPPPEEEEEAPPTEEPPGGGGGGQPPQIEPPGQGGGPPAAGGVEAEERGAKDKAKNPKKEKD